ncbi:MAG: aminotransferase class V-fold PLP-dependent enzyme [Candidatus Eremiobacteraeota bacterium]|nr:aminotransferase class V-fold PLP-dependent enzyme [Candidatus Eremiobacteraeota bacterium]
MSLDISRLREETPACRNIVHLNNAGASLVPSPVQKVVLDYLDLEQKIGGYEAEEECAGALTGVYDSLARLVNCRPQEIAITQNATRAWDMVFYGLPLGKGDRILTCRSEYASNYIAFLQRCRQTGAEIVVVEDEPDGSVCLEALERALDERVKVVAINHMPTNSGLVQPAAEIGSILQNHPAFFLLDACQSVGQTPLDVQRLGCDALTCTSRKYLRGPRGVGFLFMKQQHLENFEPPFLDLHAATWTAPSEYTLKGDGRRFETYEIFAAGKLGLGAAADYALQVGLEEAWDRLGSLAESARGRLSALPGVKVHDLGKHRSGIVTFTVDGLSPPEVRRLLRSERVNVWSSTVRSARLDMEARGLDEVVRASFHYFNTEQEVEALVSQVAKMQGCPI